MQKLNFRGFFRESHISHPQYVDGKVVFGDLLEITICNSPVLVSCRIVLDFQRTHTHGKLFGHVEGEMVFLGVMAATSFAPQNWGANKVLILNKSILFDAVSDPIQDGWNSFPDGSGDDLIQVGGIHSGVYVHMKFTVSE